MRGIFVHLSCVRASFTSVGVCSTYLGGAYRIECISHACHVIFMWEARQARVQRWRADANSNLRAFNSLWEEKTRAGEKIWKFEHISGFQVSLFSPWNLEKLSTFSFSFFDPESIGRVKGFNFEFDFYLCTKSSFNRLLFSLFSTSNNFRLPCSRYE